MLGFVILISVIIRFVLFEKDLKGAIDDGFLVEVELAVWGGLFFLSFYLLLQTLIGHQLYLVAVVSELLLFLVLAFDSATIILIRER
jgi:hypothetical protein